MGYSMRLELALVHSLNVFQSLWVLYRGHPLFLLVSCPLTVYPAEGQDTKLYLMVRL